MNAAQIVEKAAAVGIHIAIDGDDLLLEAAAPPPAVVLNLLSKHKPEIVLFLRVGGERFADAFAALERTCPAYVDSERWQQCLADARRFLANWGHQAEALGWTTEDLFELHQPPANPHPSYQRLARYDRTGLLWLLRGHVVIALTEVTAAIQTGSGAPIIYRKRSKPALGPIGDSLEDLA
jgi:hypothetical protein